MLTRVACCCSCVRYSSQSVLCQDFSGRPPSADLCVSRSKKRSSGGERRPHVLPHSGLLVTMAITVTIVVEIMIIFILPLMIIIIIIIIIIIMIMIR